MKITLLIVTVISYVLAMLQAVSPEVKKMKIVSLQSVGLGE